MLKNIASIDPIFTTEKFIKDEPMIFSASPLFAIKEGGPITIMVLNALAEAANLPQSLYKNCVIDTRVHMLKPGWSPSIPGWHCDAVPRGADGQPDFSDPAVDDILHFLCVVDAGSNSMTEFADFFYPPEFDEPKEGENVWAAHSRQINEWKETEVHIHTAKSGSIYSFDCTDYHRAVPATAHGWRYFFRASFNTKTKGPFNEIRKQTQVYMPDEDLGW